jgi:multisubunit Na+/H+ antiporter MnhC subunit
MNEIDKAERMQAWKAFLIPASLFVACLFNAAGIYILYSGSSIGVIFLGLGFAIIVTGLFLFVTFQNKHRTQGNWKRVSEDFTPPAAEPLQQWGPAADHNLTPVDPMPAYKPEARSNAAR